MRINDFKPPQIDATTSAAAAPKKSAEAPRADAPQGTDSVKVNVSARAKELAGKAMDDAKVERLRSSLEAGTFAVDAQKIAKALVGGDEE